MKRHGGNLKEASKIYGLHENKIIDFSSNINPLGISPEIKRITKKYINQIKSYPDPECNNLTESLSFFYKTDKKNILCGNGSIELIYLLPRVLPLKKATIIQPNFSEYESSLKLTRCKISYLKGIERNNFKAPVKEILSATEVSDIIYISNPNNPAGYRYSKEDLYEIMSLSEKRSCFLFIDEVFLDFLENPIDLSMVEYVNKNKHLIILKSLTKFFAIPGIRIGSIISNEKIINDLKSIQPIWSVNYLAQIIGERVIYDESYIDKSIRYVNKEKLCLYQELSKIKDIKAFYPEANYILCKILNSKNVNALQESLIKNNILIRDCSNYKGLSNKYFRIAVKTKKENNLLLKSLKTFFEN